MRVLSLILSLALAAIVAFLAVHTARLLTRKAVRFGKTQLKLSGRMTRAGAVFVAIVCALGLLLGHSALVRYHHNVQFQLRSPDAFACGHR